MVKSKTRELLFVKEGSGDQDGKEDDDDEESSDGDFEAEGGSDSASNESSSSESDEEEDDSDEDEEGDSSDDEEDKPNGPDPLACTHDTITSSGFTVHTASVRTPPHRFPPKLLAPASCPGGVRRKGTHQFPPTPSAQWAAPTCSDKGVKLVSRLTRRVPLLQLGSNAPNEDRLLIDCEKGLFGVFDGHGGATCRYTLPPCTARRDSA